MDIRTPRNRLKLSQSALARISGVSRFKICTHELGGCSLSAEDEDRIRRALQAEADRMGQEIRTLTPTGDETTEFENAPGRAVAR